MKPDRAYLSTREGLPANAAPKFRVLRSYLRLPPQPGGMENHIARLTAAQRRHGCEVVHLFHSGEAEGAQLRLLPGRDLDQIRSRTLRSLRFYASAVHAASHLRTPGLPWVLHVHGSFGDFWGGRALAHALGAQVLAASVHGTIPPRHARLYQYSLAGYDLVLATGKAEQEELEHLLGRTVHHLPSAPADLFLAEASARPDQGVDVIAVSNLFPVKGADLLLDCAARRPSLRFTLIGEGPERPRLEERIAREGLRNVDLLGHLRPDEVAARLKGARLFLSPSFKEGTPTAALEAMAVGLPVILTPSNRYDWLVEPGVNGFVTEGRAPDEVVGRIDEVLVDEGRRRAMGEVNRQRARRYGWDASAARVSMLMAEALAQKAGR